MSLIIPITDPLRKSIIDDIIAKGRKVMVIGRVDTGKSTFCRQLAELALAQGRTPAIVDADVGQSWIGPPTTIGMKLVKENADPTLFSDSFYFVGDITPEGHLLQSVVGTKKMVESAENANADLIIIDTTGLVDRPIGRFLKLNKIDLIRPDSLVFFQRDKELEILIRSVELDFCQIYRLEPSKDIERKSQEFRSQYRYEQFLKYFSEFSVQEFYFSQLCGQRDIFLNGRKASERELDIISKIIDQPAIYAEWFHRGLLLVTQSKLDWQTTRILCSQLKIDEFVNKISEDFINILVALLNSEGNLICLALIVDVDFRNCIMKIKCMNGIADQVKAIQFSDFKLYL
ncbi:MAG: Clp1/GlmU family protein [Candidatus Poribacteria bacterium]